MAVTSFLYCSLPVYDNMFLKEFQAEIVIELSEYQFIDYQHLFRHFHLCLGKYHSLHRSNSLNLALNQQTAWVCTYKKQSSNLQLIHRPEVQQMTCRFLPAKKAEGFGYYCIYQQQAKFLFECECVLISFKDFMITKRSESRSLQF